MIYTPNKPKVVHIILESTDFCTEFHFLYFNFLGTYFRTEVQGSCTHYSTKVLSVSSSSSGPIGFTRTFSCFIP